MQISERDFFLCEVGGGRDMDLHSTGFTSDDLVVRIFCDVRQCRTGGFKNGWKGGILFYD